MARLTNFFHLNLDQAQIDFVDIDTDFDAHFFIDPYALELRQDQWCAQCTTKIRSFFTALLDALRANDDPRINHLVSHLTEPRETFLGVSSQRPKGRGIGRTQSEDIVDALRQSRAFQTGLLSDLAEAELFIRGVGPDKISDLTTNIIRGSLIEYTQDQCKLLGIATRDGTAHAAIWNENELRWQTGYSSLPVVDGHSVLFVPKFIVRYRLCLDSGEYYYHHVLNFLKQEHLNNPAGGLVRILKSGERRVYKTDLKRVYPFSKEFLADFTRGHPQVLALYKQFAQNEHSLRNVDFEENFDEPAFAQALKERLSRIPRGMDDASAYHSFMYGTLTFLFYPHLVAPVKENELHQGRKRVDIAYSNAAKSGFFYEMLVANQTRALRVLVECKNYSRELGNPEIDQLAGRFGPTRGRFGILCCREVFDRDALSESCRDTALDDRGFIIVLDDRSVEAMLDNIARGARGANDQFLRQLFNDLTN
jgi:hypothetical protein